MEAKTKNIILLGAGLAGAGIAGYFSWQYWLKRKLKITAARSAGPSVAPKAAPAQKNLPASKPTAKPKSSTPRAGSFPLKKGSKSPAVKSLQQAFINLRQHSKKTTEKSKKK